jgi:hypothetical protein
LVQDHRWEKIDRNGYFYYHREVSMVSQTHCILRHFSGCPSKSMAAYNAVEMHASAVRERAAARIAVGAVADLFDEYPCHAASEPGQQI